jgi:hypothetical protein
MRADQRRIHELEYELGFRDDAPPPLPHTGEPGEVIRVDGCSPAYQEELWLRDGMKRITGAEPA